MKSYKVIVAFALLVSLNFSSYSKNQVNNVLNVSETVRTELLSHINYTKEMLEDNIEGRVVIIFRVNEDGKIVILESNSENKILEDYVISKLNNLDISKFQLDSNPKYEASFLFKIKEI